MKTLHKMFCLLVLCILLTTGCQHQMKGKVWKEGNSYAFSAPKGIKANFKDDKEQVTLDLDTTGGDDTFWLINGFLRLCGRAGEVEAQIGGD